MTLSTTAFFRRLTAVAATLAALCIALLALVTPAPALDIRVTHVDADLMDYIYTGTPRQARASVANYTVLINVQEMPAAARRILDVSGNAILFFGRDGSLAAWSDKHDVIMGGRWDVYRHEAMNSICIYFPRGNGEGACATPFSNDSTWIKQSTEGNVFGLRVGQPVPFAFPRGAGLADVAAQFP